MDYELKYYYLHVILVIALALVVISSANARNPISITVDLGKYSLSCMESVSLYNANKLDNCQSANVHFSPSPIASENPFSILR